MKYKYMGRLVTTLINAEKIKCDWCNNTQLSLCGLKEIETDKNINICDNCKDKIYSEIDFSR